MRLNPLPSGSHFAGRQQPCYLARLPRASFVFPPHESRNLPDKMIRWGYDGPWEELENVSQAVATLRDDAPRFDRLRRLLPLPLEDWRWWGLAMVCVQPQANRLGPAQLS